MSSYSKSWKDLSLHPLQSEEWSRVYPDSLRLIVGNVPYMIRLSSNPLTRAPFALLLKPSGAQLEQETLEKLTSELAAKVPKLSHVIVEPHSTNDLSWLDSYPLSPSIARYTVVNGLELPVEELLAACSKSHRQNIRKARSRGFTSSVSSAGDDAIDRFIAVMESIQTSKSFIQFGMDHYRRVWQLMSESNKAAIVIGEFEGKDIGAYMFVHAHGTAYQLYGGRNETGRSERLAQALAFDAMVAAKDLGCRQYDMWGIGAFDSNGALDTTDEKYGIGQFKSAFGGVKTVYSEPKVIVLSKLNYRLFLLGKRLRNRITWIRKKL
ncbi:MAG: GNAT family N-acetyltransferase [Patescibacteria group bacterium]